MLRFALWPHRISPKPSDRVTRTVDTVPCSPHPQVPLQEGTHSPTFWGCCWKMTPAVTCSESPQRKNTASLRAHLLPGQPACAAWWPQMQEPPTPLGRGLHSCPAAGLHTGVGAPHPEALQLTPSSLPCFHLLPVHVGGLTLKGSLTSTWNAHLHPELSFWGNPAPCTQAMHCLTHSPLERFAFYFLK